MSILKWVGGKKQLLNELDNHFPETVINYYEPFGGSLTVTLRVFERYPKANIYVADINPRLTNMYLQLKKNPDRFIEAVKLLIELDEDYGTMRERFNTTNSKLEEAILMFILNKKCFNGLYRVNKSGKFNVPQGKNSICWENQVDNLQTFSRFVGSPRVHISTGGFKEFFDKFHPGEGDLVYVDPPYWDTFTAYDGSGFTREDQEELFRLCASFESTVICSNSDTDMIHQLYGTVFDIHVLNVRRSVNRDAEKRRGTEVLMMKKNLPQ